MDLWKVIDSERAEFANLCDVLSLDQWNAMSLCSAWRVRDVAGHVIEVASGSAPRFFAAMARYGFRLGTTIEREAIKHGTRTTPEGLRVEMRATIGLRRALPGVKTRNVLTGELIHQQDIRRALNLRRTIEPARLEIALGDVSGMAGSILPGKKRTADLFLRATDLDWQLGESTSPEVMGTGEALLMAMAGRPAALTDLTGDGVGVMRARMGTAMYVNG